MRKSSTWSKKSDCLRGEYIYRIVVTFHAYSSEVATALSWEFVMSSWRQVYFDSSSIAHQFSSKVPATYSINWFCCIIEIPLPLKN